MGRNPFQTAFSEPSQSTSQRRPQNKSPAGSLPLASPSPQAQQITLFSPTLPPAVGQTVAAGQQQQATTKQQPQQNLQFFTPTPPPSIRGNTNVFRPNPADRLAQSGAAVSPPFPTPPPPAPSRPLTLNSIINTRPRSQQQDTSLPTFVAQDLQGFDLQNFHRNEEGQLVLTTANNLNLPFIENGDIVGGSAKNIRLSGEPEVARRPTVVNAKPPPNADPRQRSRTRTRDQVTFLFGIDQ